MASTCTRLGLFSMMDSGMRKTDQLRSVDHDFGLVLLATKAVPLNLIE